MLLVQQDLDDISPKSQLVNQDDPGGGCHAGESSDPLSQEQHSAVGDSREEPYHDVHFVFMQGLVVTDGAGKILYSRDLDRQIALEGIALARSKGG